MCDTIPQSFFFFLYAMCAAVVAHICARAEEGVLRLLLQDESLFGDQAPLTQAQFSSPLLGKAYALLWQLKFSANSATVSSPRLGGSWDQALTVSAAASTSTAASRYAAGFTQRKGFSM